MLIDKKLYPSEKNFQKSTATEVSLSWAIAYLEDMQNQVSATEKDTIVLRGWDGVSLHYKHTPTEMEILEARLAAIRQMLMSAPRDGLTGEQVQQLKSLL